MKSMQIKLHCTSAEKAHAIIDSLLAIMRASNYHLLLAEETEEVRTSNLLFFKVLSYVLHEAHGALGDAGI